MTKFDAMWANFKKILRNLCHVTLAVCDIFVGVVFATFFSACWQKPLLNSSMRINFGETK